MATLKLSSFLKGISGRTGNAVYRLTLNGTELSDRPLVNNPSTKAQQLVRAAFTKSTQGWRNLTAAQVAAWNNYARFQKERNDVSGNVTSRSGFNWYVALSSRFYFVNGLAGTAPATPPTSNFTGDGLSFVLTGRTGAIQIQASAANSPGTTTAILIQRLRSVNSKPQKNGYRTVAHVVFASGSLSADISVEPGVYAVATQYVRVSTGQETSLNPVGLVGPITLAVKKAA